ncbi:hypothetical protein ACFPPA_18945 [Rhodanobacter ginsengisoli]|uniref:Uncharacterized protein n=1 Tax=Rhodanobacter ginsengisoli TaxID=418646 RepID=A0ABW0QY49_9GAMM
MKRLVFYLLGFGLLCLLSAINGIASFGVGTAGTSIGHHSSWLLRTVAFANGVVFLWLAYGVHRRLNAAWRVGMFALAAGWAWLFVMVCLFIAQDAQAYPAYGRVGSVALIMVASSFVFLYWGRRWYASRSYFTEPSIG